MGNDPTEGRRIRGHLSWFNVEVRLRGMREIWVALTRPDGRPHTVPVWFWWDGTSLYFTARAGTLKPRSLSQNPAVVVHNGDGADPIIIEGTAILLTAPDAISHVSAAYAEKYVDPGSGTSAAVDPENEAVFRVAVHRVQTWSYANVSTQTVWEFVISGSPSEFR